MGTALAQSDAGDALTTARRWVDLPADERKRRAAAACRDRDVAQLWELTEAHLTLYGKAGARVSPHTRKAYRGAVTQLIAAWTHLNLLHPTRDDAALWIRGMEQSGLAPATITVRLAGARALYRALRWTEVTSADPFQDVRPAADPTPPEEKRQPYSNADIDRLLALAGPADRLLILLTAHAGLRISEALALLPADVDLAAGTIVVQHGKGGKKRTVRASRTLLTELGDTTSVITPERRLLPISDQTARNHIRTLCALAGIQNRAVHAFRHSCGTRIYEETGKLELAQHQLGHSQPSTTLIYAKMSDARKSQAVENW